MYRRTLAASWAASRGELPADQCVEDIFNGGSGWKHNEDPQRFNNGASQPSDSETQYQLYHHRSHSGSSLKSQSTITERKAMLGHKHSASRDSIDRSSNQGQNDSSSENASDRGRTVRRSHEVDEFEVRDDLVAWRMPSGVTG